MTFSPGPVPHEGGAVVRQRQPYQLGGPHHDKRQVVYTAPEQPEVSI